MCYFIYSRGGERHLDVGRRHRHTSGTRPLPAINDSFDAFELLGLERTELGQVSLRSSQLLSSQTNTAIATPHANKPQPAPGNGPDWRRLSKQRSAPGLAQPTAGSLAMARQARPRPHSSGQIHQGQVRALPSGQASQLKRKLSRKLDISYDQLDSSAFPFPFLNTIVSPGVGVLYLHVPQPLPGRDVSVPSQDQ